eukprot:4767722-Pyramimonas_sp.AAC.1
MRAACRRSGLGTAAPSTSFSSFSARAGRDRGGPPQARDRPSRASRGPLVAAAGAASKSGSGRSPGG